MAILMSLPLSLIGVMPGLAISGLMVSIMSRIGVILLAGIVARNTFLLLGRREGALFRHSSRCHELSHPHSDRLTA